MSSMSSSSPSMTGSGSSKSTTNSIMNNTPNSTPMKPPRGHHSKSSKETGILMTVIKTLSSTVSNDHRDHEKTKLDKEYKQSDARLDGLIAQKQESLNNVMSTFSNVCTQISMAKDRIQQVKSNLQKCKMLLHCKRKELETLWLEGIEHKYALEILEQTNHFRGVSQQFSKVLGRKQYLQGAEILMSSLNSWNDTLEKIEGLRDVHNDLLIKKQKLYETLLEELNNELFVKSSPVLLEMKRQGSGMFAPFQRSSSDRLSSGRNRMNNIKARRIYLDITAYASGDHGSKNGPTNAVDDQKKVNEHQELYEFMSTVVQCMTLLKELPRFNYDLKKQLDEKLLSVVNNISQQIIDYADETGTRDTNDSSALLVDLLQLTFVQFRSIIQFHQELLRLIGREVESNRLQVQLFKEKDLWTKVQFVLQSTLKIYFDLSDSKSSSVTINTSTNFVNSTISTTSDINSFFLKKKQPRLKKLPLFKFEYSLHGLTSNDVVVGDSGDRSLLDRHRYLVCKPNPRNIIVIYKIVQQFCQEVEQALEGEKSDLRKFMNFNVNRVFVQQLYKDITEAVEQTKKNPDSWRDVTSLEEAKSLKATRPLLQNVVIVGRSMLEIMSLAKQLPSHSDQLIRIMDPVLTSYKDLCLEIYNSILRPEVERVGSRGILSANWVKDEDIERHLKSLPNWIKLQQIENRNRSISIDESPDDLRSQNMKESDLLYTIHGGKAVLASEIVNDSRLLEQLAHFHESLEWFADTVASVVSIFESNTNDADLLNIIDKLHSLALQFKELGDTCLLVVHLEIRIHCFHYISPLAQKGEFSPGIDNQIADTEVVHLNKDLAEVDRVLSSALEPVKWKYVFEGLSQLISTILIRGSVDIRRMNENGVKKICRDIYSIQQTLCNITNKPEQALDHARQYFELFLLHSIDDIFDTILEKGPQFKELEYMNAVQLLFRSRPGQTRTPNQTLSEYLTKLSSVLGDIGVTV